MPTVLPSVRLSQASHCSLLIASCTGPLSRACAAHACGMRLVVCSSPPSPPTTPMLQLHSIDFSTPTHNTASTRYITWDNGDIPAPPKLHRPSSSSRESCLGAVLNLPGRQVLPPAVPYRARALQTDVLKMFRCSGARASPRGGACRAHTFILIPASSKCISWSAIRNFYRITQLVEVSSLSSAQCVLQRTCGGRTPLPHPPADARLCHCPAGVRPPPAGIRGCRA